MSKASPYRDLVKANDLITKNFLKDNSFAVVTETKAGDVSFKSTVSADNKKPVAAVIEPKYEWKENNLAFEAKISTALTASGKATFKNVGIEGLNLSVQGEKEVKKEKDEALKLALSGTGGLQFNNELAHLVVDVKFTNESKLSASGSLHAKPVDNVDVGVKVDWEDGTTKFEGKLIGGNDDMEGAIAFAYPSKVLGVNFWHSCCAKFQWALGVSAPPSDAKKDPEIVVNVAGNYKLDDSTTLKAKVTASVDRSSSKDHAFRCALSLQQKVNANTTVTVGSDVNVNNAWSIGSGKKGTNVGAASSCGFQIAFK